MRGPISIGLFASLVVAFVAGCAPGAAPSPPAKEAPKAAAPADKAAAPADKAAAVAAAPGFKIVASRDEIVEKAKQEGKLRALASLDPAGLKLVEAGFKKAYPFIDFYIEEFTGTDSYQRFLLELQSGTVGDWDVGYAPPEYYSTFEGYMDKYDILTMAEKGILQIPPKMVDPSFRNMVTMASQAAGNTINPKLVPPEQRPKTWEDLLKPEWRGKKIVVDVRPSNIAPLVPLWGLDKTVDYARKLAAQEPIWDRGQTAALTKLAAGDLLMHTFSNYHSAIRVQTKASAADIQVDLLEPIPLRISETQAVLKTAKRPHAALLFLEYMTSPEAQKILDDSEIKASIYGSGGKLQELTRGKQVSVADYQHFEKMEGYMQKIVEAFGFPKAELGK
jgi:iron(III) transport system substrate-binding protein